MSTKDYTVADGVQIVVEDDNGVATTLVGGDPITLDPDDESTVLRVQFGMILESEPTS